MIIALLKFILMAMISCGIFIAYSDIPLLNQNPIASLVVLFIIVAIIARNVPVVLMFVLKLALFMGVIVLTAFLLGHYYNVKIPYLPDFSKAKTFDDVKQVLSGVPGKIEGSSLFKMGDHLIKLYGVAEPDKETCHDGDTDCEEAQKNELKSEIKGQKVTCLPITEEDGVYLATCTTSDGKDVGASLISKGLRLADKDQTSSYDKEEEEARKEKRGIWKQKAGSFIHIMKERLNEE